MGQQCSFMKLPNHAQVLALRMFDDIELIAFSVLSNRTLTVAKSLNRTSPVRVNINRDVTVYVGTNSDTSLKFYHKRNAPPTEFHIPNTINVEMMSTDRSADLVWENETMEWKTWILHIMEIFHQSSLDQITINSDHRFSLNGIHSLLADLKVDILLFLCLSTPTIQAPSLLSPSQSLHIRGRNPFNPSIEMQKMLLQNVPVINVFDFQNFQLNDLLSCNCREVIARHVHFSAKKLRRWLKLWKNGANPRLESMNFAFYSTDQQINWFVENLAQHTHLTREIFMGYVYRGADVRNGFEIWRKDRRVMAHVVVTREEEMNRVLCTIRMEVFN